MTAIRECVGMMYTKKCGCCGEVKPITMFNKDVSRKDGYRYVCKVCLKKQRKKKHPDITLRDRVKQKYNCTAQEYKDRMATSDCCELCGRKDTLCYDHCHVSGKFRGVLCRQCNTSLGKLGDTFSSIMKVLNYVKRGE